MIEGIENWLDWDVYERSIMSQWYYKGQDERLTYGKRYELTIAWRREGGKGGCNVSIHVDKTKRVYKMYNTRASFVDEWSKYEVTDAEVQG